MSAIFIDGQLAHYEVIGRGKAVLFLHSWVGSWRYWVPTMQAISPNFRAYALDLWGFGESAKNDQYAIKDQVALVKAFTEKIGLGQVVLIGHGLGAIVACEFAMIYSDMVDKIFAISLPSVSDLLNTRLLSAEQSGLVDKIMGKGPETEVIRGDEHKNDPQAIRKTISDPELRNSLMGLDLFEKTSLLVYGQNDPIVQVPDTEKIQSIRKNMHTIIFKESGHFPMLEESSKFARLLSEFLVLGEEDSPANLHIKEKWQRKIR